MEKKKKITNKLKIENDGSKIAVLGLQGSGKTYFVKKLLKIYKYPVVFQVNKDDNYKKLKNCLVYEADSHLEFKQFFKFIYNIIKNNKGTKKIDAIVLDEADLYVPTNFEVIASPEFSDMVANHRHYGVSLILISRRPQDISAKVIESCKHIIIFSLQGSNAKKKLNDISDGMGNMQSKLKYQDYGFIYKRIGEEPKIYPKIK